MKTSIAPAFGAGARRATAPARPSAPSGRRAGERGSRPSLGTRGARSPGRWFFSSFR
ncbi:hypothetical protein [Aureimonas sp. AU40]|uniref:hypothetical protein n=1 Tax=Aureimonas sp. AU40 TaxID=1637747 RepID=UPI00178CC595|nr:hypothetical protein [Aureimonas sp. AU40]